MEYCKCWYKYPYYRYEFENAKCKYIIDNNSMIWFEEETFLESIEYDVMNSNNKKTLNKIYECEKQLCEIFKNQKLRRLTDNNKNKIFISENGINILLKTMKNAKVKKFKKALIDEIIPYIKKTGKYRKDKKYHILLENELNIYGNKNVLYIGYYINIEKIETHNKIEKIYVWGKSHGTILNELREKQNKFYGFEILFVTICEKNIIVEKLFENEIKKIDLICHPIRPNIQTLFQKENNNVDEFKNVFKLKNEYILNNVIEIMKKLVKDNSLDKMKEIINWSATMDNIFHPYNKKFYTTDKIIKLPICSDNFNHKINRTNIDENLKIKHYIKIGEECVICKNEIWSSKNAILTECGHCYHYLCIKKYAKNKCPLCKQEMGLHILNKLSKNLII